jgi:aminocarboxymuconate-semialdehyde decarboxylase
VYWADPTLALELCRITNDHLASFVERYPGRFIAGAVVPLQDPALAVEELRRAVGDLGHRMVLLGTNIHGVQLDDPALEPFYSEVERLDIPVFVHPIRPAGVECMHDFRLDLSIGFPNDTALAAARLALSGMLDRHPALRFCWSHMGGAFLWQLDRIEMVRDTLPGSADRATEAMQSYLRHYWFDTKVPSLRNLRFGVEVAGADRLMFGTDVPFFDNMTPALIDLVRSAPFLDEADRDAILRGNAEAFLGLT